MQTHHGRRPSTKLFASWTVKSPRSSSLPIVCKNFSTTDWCNGGAKAPRASGETNNHAVWPLVEILVSSPQRDIRNKMQNWGKKQLNLFALAEKLLWIEKVCQLLLTWLLRAEGEEERGRTPGRHWQKMLIYENLFTVDVFNLQRLFLKIKLMLQFFSPETYSRTPTYPNTHLLHRKSTVAFPNLTWTMGNWAFSCFLFLVLRCTQCVWLCWPPPQPHETPVLPCSVNHTARVYKRTDNSASI